MNLKKIPRYLFDKQYRFSVNAQRGFYRSMPDEEFLCRMYEAKTGKKLELEHPVEFNQKLQWMKLYYRNPLLTTLVDKAEAKKYVAERIGEEYIIPTYGVWNSFDEIDFDQLPEQFVLKGTHDSKSVVVCRDKSKLDWKKAKKTIDASLSKNYYEKYREWAYKDVPPRVIAEKFMQDDSGEELSDYKVMCFGGEPKIIQVHHGRFSYHTQDIYDQDWNKMDIDQGATMPTSPEEMPKPAFLEEMLRLSRTLAEGFPEVRVDWYYAENHLYFGEMTFYDAAGWDDFRPDIWNKIIGDWIVLPEKQQ